MGWRHRHREELFWINRHQPLSFCSLDIDLKKKHREVVSKFPRFLEVLSANFLLKSAYQWRQIKPYQRSGRTKDQERTTRRRRSIRISLMLEN
ncbi:hypothetical protein QVD17_19387 [Tagetes erecta]|uniref:Uncharacterized protein n=1 Tax=Tagetes erecta TaxID=13708 RepID=A0AAD8KQW0_TARER|nr:hypothetical protein QVD17_19387 [Tagetes erecta]